MARATTRCLAASAALVLLAAGCATTSGTGVGRAPRFERTKEEDVRLLVKLSTGGAAGMLRQLDVVFGQFTKAFPQVPDEFWQEMRSRIDPDEFVDMLVPIYDRHFSHEEIVRLIEFYRSPIGRRLVEEQPAIMQESFEAGARWGEKLAREILEELEKRGFAPPRT